MSRVYIDFDLSKGYPNKYNLTPENIKQLKIVDWERLKTHTWHNNAMKDTGNWWCHLEGCQKERRPYDLAPQLFLEESHGSSFYFAEKCGLSTPLKYHRPSCLKFIPATASSL